MMTDPWKDIALPSTEDVIKAKRVDASLQWGFFWARSVDRKYLLVLRHAPESAPANKLPKLSGIDVDHADYGTTEKMLIFKLQDDSQKDIFLQLCTDIIAATNAASDERDAVSKCLARTWRWHYLLRGGADGRLSPEEQKGLIGELLVIQNLLLSRLAPADILNAWRGPLDSPKDFEIGRVCIEAKARRSAAVPCVTISSVHQLDTTDIDALFLYVVNLDISPQAATGARTVTEYAMAVKDRLLAKDGSVGDNFDSLLFAGGFRWADDYSDTFWLEGQSSLFAVREGFPRISSDKLVAGVVELKYGVLIAECAPFLVQETEIDSALA